MAIKANTFSVGEDGRIYFKYNVGAVYAFSPEYANPFYYEIKDSEYYDDEEKYLVQNGEQDEVIKTAKQLDFLFAMIPYEVIAPGEPKELPLMPEEVETYYKAKKQWLEVNNKLANEKLKGTDYGKLLKSKYTLQHELKLAEAEGNDEYCESLVKRIADIEEQTDKLIKENGVNKNVLRKVALCNLCKDTGIINGKICRCAYEREPFIKAYNARLRLENK